jgi:hypothetical protein
MLMGTVAAMRAQMRGRQSVAQDLLGQALARIGMRAPDLQAGDPMLVLVDEAERRYTELESLAERVRNLIRETAAQRSGTARTAAQPARV